MTGQERVGRRFGHERQSETPPVGRAFSETKPKLSMRGTPTKNVFNGSARWSTTQRSSRSSTLITLACVAA
jgi:hypothetical protein